VKLLLPLLLSLLTSTSFAQISVVDFQKRRVTVAAPAQRIVALAPHIVENVFSAGAGSKLVGVASYSNYPEAAKAIEVIGDYKSWSLEAIAALQPDLILIWASGNGMNAFSSLEKLGVPIFVSEPRQLEDIPYAIRAIGKLAGTEEYSEPEARRIEQALESLGETYGSRSSLSLFYQVWNEPLQTLNGEHMISSVIALCGGRNAFADAVSLAPKISIESVLHRNPDAIVASGMAGTRPPWLDMWLQYPSLNAVKNNTLFFVHPDHIQRPTARILLGAKDLCEQLDTARGGKAD
jgi:iron complex transport system substrate-binding protein